MFDGVGGCFGASGEVELALYSYSYHANRLRGPLTDVVPETRAERATVTLVARVVHGGRVRPVSARAEKVVRSSGAPEKRKPPLHKRAWFWPVTGAVVGLVVVVASVGIGLSVGQQANRSQAYEFQIEF